MTTGLEMMMLRFWTIGIDVNIVGFPSELSCDAQLGKRTYAAWQTYDYIRDMLSEDLIMQDNPTSILDRPSDLYSTRQMAISVYASYGVPEDDYEKMVDQGIVIFESETINWEQIDSLCQQYSIDLLIKKDIDSIRASLDELRSHRSPIYANDYYTLFRCGADQ